MSNELQTVKQIEYSLAELNGLAQAFVDCGFYGYKNQAEALVLMLQARADGIDPMTAANQYSIIQGRPSLKAEAILIRFQANGGSIKWVKRTDEECTLWLSHPKGGELEVTWNKDRATKAGLWNKDNFKKHPAQMLAARCISEGVRALFPACLSGCYTPEETVFFNDAPEQPKAAPAPKTEPKAEKPKASAKKAAAVDAEVVSEEPEAVEALDEQTAGFVNFMEGLKASNPAVFDAEWAKVGFAKLSDVPVAEQRAIALNVKKAISAAAANNINDYLEG